MGQVRDGLWTGRTGQGLEDGSENGRMEGAAINFITTKISTIPVLKNMHFHLLQTVRLDQ